MALGDGMGLAIFAHCTPTAHRQLCQNRFCHTPGEHENVSLFLNRINNIYRKRNIPIISLSSGNRHSRVKDVCMKNRAKLYFSYTHLLFIAFDDKGQAGGKAV
jgi:hypothetical protein